MIKKTTVRSALLKVMIITSIVTMLLVGIVLSVITFSQSLEREERDLSFYISSLQLQLSTHIQFLEDGITYIRSNSKIKDFLDTNAGDKKEIEKILERGINLFSDGNMVEETYPVIGDIYLFSKNMNSVSTHFYPETSAARVAKERRIRRGIETYKNNSNSFFYIKYGNSLELYFTLYNEDLEPLGYCGVIFNLSSINNIFYKSNKYEKYYWILSGNEGELLTDTAFSINDIKGIKKGLADRVKLKNTVYYYGEKIHSFGLRSYILVPKVNLYFNILPAFLLSWIIAISTFIGVFIAISYFANRLTSPLENIVDKLKQVGKGDFNTRLETYQLLELQEVSDSFNDMAAKINHLIKEVYENELLVKEAKLHYLQAQINPHFLFNVLSMIAIRLKINKEDELYKLVNALSGLMQGKLFKKDEIEIALKDEIKIAEFYLYLSGERFKDTISYEIIWEDEDLKDCMIPKLCIEPFVENAVIHGIEPKADKGKIELIIKRKDSNTLFIIVRDDGIGFCTDKIKEKGEFTHPRVGIMNIQRLINNLYGNDYGINIISSVNIGTTIEITLPLTKQKLV